MKHRVKVILTVLSLGLSVSAAESGTALKDCGEIRIVSSSHQDTAWMNTPAACMQFRIDHNIMPALEMMRKDPNYTFCMECALHLMEFLEVHPEMRGEVIQRMKEGRLEFGATYNQPYEDYLSGEELVRQTYYGRRWITKNLPGCEARVAFNPDTPARSLQMAQILSKAGIPYMFISRYHEGLYNWKSPDGSSVLAYTPGHYKLHRLMLEQKADESIRMISEHLPAWQAYNRTRDIPQVFCLINSMDFSKPVDFSPLLEGWRSQPDAVKLPVMRYASIAGYFDQLTSRAGNFDSVMGLRPNMWLYITGPTHHWTASVRREAARVLPAAETFCTMACLLKKDFSGYPSKKFDEAWMDEIYIDHGIGGNKGHITDAVFHNKVVNALTLSREILEKSLADISARIKTDSGKGKPVFVYNTLSWKRTDRVDLDVPADCSGGVLKVVDSDGNEMPTQLTVAGAPDELNVALATAGARATANSEFSSDFGAGKAIDGRWDVREPDKALGGSTQWRTKGSAGPEWLVIDFGKTRTIHKVVLRHEGVMGVYEDETRCNTSDFQLQSADSPEGPWVDLVPPVVSNTASLTVHEFAARPVRFLRLYVTKGTQTADPMVRVYELEAFEKVVTKKPGICFMAQDVPSLGYKTYYLQKDDKGAVSKVDAGGSFAGRCENDFYRIELVPGGIKSIYDKKLGFELLKSDNLLGGEVFTMVSPLPDQRAKGTDAGEFAIIPQPGVDDTYDRVARHKPEWAMVEQGALFSAYELRQKLRDAVVRQRMVLWHGIKRIDFEVFIENFNGNLWREYRMALPLALEKPQITYEVPFGVVRVGKDEVPTTGGRAYDVLSYDEQLRDIRPREVQNFVDVSNTKGGVTMSSDVTAFDWKDLTVTNNPATVIQPILLATRKSCNRRGNSYPQAGDHQYRFSITSHEGGWQNGRKSGLQANNALIPVTGLPGVGTNATLPAEMSFLSVSANNVIISTVKKCEDDDSVIVRAYDIEGRDSIAGLTLFNGVQRAEQVSLLEEGGKPLQVSKGRVELSVGHHSIETVKLDPNSGCPKSEPRSVIEFPFVPLPGAKVYADKSRAPEERAAAVLAEMTIKEKLNSVGGFKLFYSPSIERLGMRPLYFSDASQGVHIREKINTGLDQSTAFPCTLALAATWDPGLANRYARSIGEECRAGDIAVLLGPGMNIYRNSRCGRNFEYLGEDPFLAGQLVAAYVTGLQASGTMATLKHFLGNNSETLRKTCDTVMSERALHELYTPAFRAGIDAGAGAVMTSYNLVNGEWVGHSRTLVDGVLRKEFGFRGVVMSDWSAVHNVEKFMRCEMDLLMPGVREGELEKLYADKKFSEKDLDEKILRWLTAFFKMGFYDRPQKDPLMLAKFPEHEATALRAARESIVLLSNPKSILPLNSAAYKKIVVVGNAAKGVYSMPGKGKVMGGGGSGAVNGYNTVTLMDALKKEFGDRVSHLAESRESEIRSADLVIVAVSTSDAECSDRLFELGKEGAGVAAKCAALNPNTILISQVGGGYALTDCYDKVAAHLFALFLGQTQGTAIVDVLMGRVNPSGKLPFTIEKQFKDSPASVYPAVELSEGFPDAGTSKCGRVEYKEDVFVGYRWYEARKIAPLYPFGFGLSYTAFKYDNLKLSAAAISGAEVLKVSFTVVNTGKVPGAEVAQLYVQDTHSSVPRPGKELKGFKKVMLQPGETSMIELSIGRKDLSYWDESVHDWKAEPGTFTILVASSSADIQLKGAFELTK